jgi:2-polyprenyl-3-methyl-5-hydroxy-6-metoxy-1,4-benzoquinol methylase
VESLEEFVYLQQRDREEIVSMIPDTYEKALDVGTGDGFMALSLARKGYSVTSIEIEERILEGARKNARQAGVEGKIKFLQGDAAELNFTGEFDLVISYNALHHMEKWKETVAGMVKACRSGGMLFICELNEKGLEGVSRMHRQRKKEHQVHSVDFAEIKEAYAKDFTFEIQKLHLSLCLFGKKK